MTQPTMQTPAGPVPCREVWGAVMRAGLTSSAWHLVADAYGVAWQDVRAACDAWSQWDAQHRPPVSLVDAAEVEAYAHIARVAMSELEAGDVKAARYAQDATRAWAEAARRTSGVADDVVIDLTVNGRRLRSGGG